MKKTLMLALLIVLCAAVTAGLAQTGVKKKRPLPHEYGRVVMNGLSGQAGLAGVEFEHWFHRTRYTCRLCHVDLTFAMKAGGTNVKASDNAKGFYCGACHNGKSDSIGKKVFESCATKYSREDLPRCIRCHSVGKNVKKEHDFDAVTARFPRERFGNGINWEKAEADGMIKLVDELPGLSIHRPPMAIQKDFTIGSANETIPEIIFSHKKHTVWNGCELCHPEIFIGVKRGQTKYSMVDNYNGKFCGVCHGAVAFPLLDCQRCHVKPVQPS
jgi:c(7)-type cytochrome triheme protein